MGTKDPLVSIIIPAKNEELNIERLLSSIKLQSYKFIESIVIDDGSNDQTVKLAKKHASKVFSREHAERSVQRNFGAKQSKGNYLVFVDADMELTTKVIEDCVNLAKSTNARAIIIPEKTVGSGLLTQVRRFEREMYLNDKTIEVARFFDRKVFFEFDGYDKGLTGPEDFDLPYRISKKYSLERASEYILHHELNTSLKRLLWKKYYYAKKGALYASKHPELLKSQGNLLFRKAYVKNWKKFVSEPLIGVIFILVRVLEATAAVFGFVSAVGIGAFVKTLKNMFIK